MSVIYFDENSLRSEVARMPESLDDLAPWPQTEKDATADALIKAIAVRAYARAARIHDLGGDLTREPALTEYRNLISVLVNEFGVVRLLRFLKDFHRDVADDAARLLWSGWEDGGGIDELLWDWLTEYRIDPERVIRLAEKQRAEQAAAS